MRDGKKPLGGIGYGISVIIGIYLCLRIFSRCGMYMLPLLYFSGEGVGEIFVFIATQMIGCMALHQSSPVIVIKG
ncbi:hypothetical protein DSECCO2_660260 [anaerobic digester metagenome]